MNSKLENKTMGDTPTAKAEQTFWDIIKDRIGNPFILSALIAFVFNYRIKLYQLAFVSSFDEGKEIIKQLTPWSCDYIGELLLVIGLYYLSVFLGEGVTWIKHQIVSFFQKWVEKKTFLDSKDQANLIDKIARLNKDVSDITTDRNKFKDELSRRTHILFSLLNFNQDKGVELTFSAFQKNPNDCQPFVYDIQSNQVSNLKPFDKLEDYHRIMFKTYQFGNNQSESISFQIRKLDRLVSMNLGNKELFSFMNNIAPYGATNIQWKDSETIYIDPTNSHWQVLKDQKPNTFIKLTKGDGKVHLNVKFD